MVSLLPYRHLNQEAGRVHAFIEVSNDGLRIRFADGGRTTLSTVTITPVEVEVFHAASRAVAVMV